MSHEFEGLYFDGLSSSPHDVDLSINNSTSEIIISSKDIGEKRWLIRDTIPHLAGGKITIRHSSDDNKTITVSDGSFNEKFFHLFHRIGNKGIYYRLIHGNIFFILIAAISILALSVAAYFFLVPKLAEKAVNFVPLSYDETLGNTAYNNLIDAGEIDSAKTDALNRFANEIDFGTDRQLNFTVVDSKTINAFALPDGNIVVYTGILNKMTSYSQLVALLSHEATHVTQRHSMKALCRSVSGFLVVSIVFSDVNGIMAILAENANELNNLSYSRSFETEADEIGFSIMKRNKIESSGMMELFSILKDSHEGSIPEFLSTHPLTDERIKNAKKLNEESVYTHTDNFSLREIFENQLRSDSKSP